jgi:glycosyltransferase involved in cell wall biosynthesis
MAVGAPVVATDIYGSRELINHGVIGILVPPQDPGALAQAVMGLLDDVEKRNSVLKEGQ